MPTTNQIQAAYRAGIIANTAQAALLRDLRRPWRDGNDTIDDLAEAMRYLAQTSPANVDEARFDQALALILPAAPTMEWTPATGRGARDVRNRIRALMVDASSPQWLKDRCQRIKRTFKIDQNQAGERVFDQQNTDPIVALADAAIVVLAAAGSTREQLLESDQTLALYRELTP